MLISPFCRAGFPDSPGPFSPRLRRVLLRIRAVYSSRALILGSSHSALFDLGCTYMSMVFSPKLSEKLGRSIMGLSKKQAKRTWDICYSADYMRRKPVKIVKFNILDSSWKETRSTSKSMRLFMSMDIP